MSPPRLRVLARALGFALPFAVATALALAGDARLAGRPLEPRLLQAIGLFTLGAFLAGLVAWPLAGRLFGRRPASARFAGAILLLAFGTASAAALMFFLQYRLYYADSHGAFPSLDWIFHFLVTGAAAAYLFAVTGLPLFLPIGIAVLFAGAAAIARWNGRGPA